jgi:hypothetical protein
MVEIRNYEQKPIVLIRTATVQELAAYEKQKLEKINGKKLTNNKVKGVRRK